MPCCCAATHNIGSELRQSIARDLLEDMRREYPALIAQETMVIEELIRIAVTWEEVCVFSRIHFVGLPVSVTCSPRQPLPRFYLWLPGMARGAR